MSDDQNWVDSENDKGGFENVPQGRYQVLIDAIEVKQTKQKQKGEAQKGEFIEVRYDILNDQYAGRKLFDRFNVSNDNQTAQNIGRGQFGNLCKATGTAVKIAPPKDQNGIEIQEFAQRKGHFDAQLGSALLNKVVVLEVVVKYDDFRKAEVNEIKKYLPKETALTQDAAGAQGGELF